jgi:hypothetical protein
MRTNRFVARLGFVALTAMAFGACAPEGVTTAPAIAPGAAHASLDPAGDVPVDGAQAKPSPLGRMSVTGVRRARGLASDITVERVIGPRGGRLEVEGAGFSLVVPAGAVAEPTAFRVTALAGELLAYEFGPSGSSFAVPLQATQDLRATNVHRLPTRATLNLGYFAAPTDVDAATGTAIIAQETTGTVHPSGRSATFPIPHFSGWIIHWRSGGTRDSTGTR